MTGPLRNTRMPRTRSSLLKLSIREWRMKTDTNDLGSVLADDRLKTASTKMSTDVHIDQESRNMTWQEFPLGDEDVALNLSGTDPNSAPGGGSVWVDCYFYGFWINEDTVAQYKDSVQLASSR